MLKLWFFIQAFAIEIGAILFIIDSNMMLADWFLFYLAHSIACASYSLACWFLLPQSYRDSWLKAQLFLFFFTLFMPLIGMVGTSLSLIVALYLPKKQSDVTWDVCEEIPLPQHPGEINQDQFGTGALAEILVKNEDVERRLIAVSAVQHFSRKAAVPLLQMALKDLSDDVRLLAYSSLETIETEINTSIGLCKKQYESKHVASKAAEIAHHYWELCYLGIAEGSLLKHYLREAARYLSLANQESKNASNDLLLGRILLKQGQFKLASEHLKRAQEGGLLARQVLPYLAECAFELGNYSEVKTLCKQFPTQ
ncbi:MAG: hypothetical protein ACPGJI_05140, partial [Kangiellaceae bacterium]